MITKAYNPVWGNEAKTLIDFVIEIDGVDGEIPHSSGPGEDLYERARAGRFGEIGPMRAPPKVASEILRARLNILAQQTIDAGYCGKRQSLYGYMAQINALIARDAATDAQRADLDILLDAAAWEQAVLDVAASATDTAGVPWPAPPAPLAGLAAAS